MQTGRWRPAHSGQGCCGRRYRWPLPRLLQLLRLVRPVPWPPPWMLFWPRRAPWSEPVAPRAGRAGAILLDRPCDGRDRLERPRWTTNGSSRPSRGTGRGREPPCWSARAHERARRHGSSSATALTAFLRRHRSPNRGRRTPILAHQWLGSAEPCSSSSARTTWSRSASTADRATRWRSARSNARRRMAASTHPGESPHSQAPRPGWARPRTSAPDRSCVTRTSSSAGRTRRHPMQVRRGAMPDRPRLRLPRSSPPPDPWPHLPGCPRRPLRPRPPRRPRPRLPLPPRSRRLRRLPRRLRQHPR